LELGQKLRDMMLSIRLLAPRPAFSFCLALFWLFSAAAAPSEPPRPKVLVYTRNQVGPGLYVHDNIAASVEAIKKLAAQGRFDLEVSDDPRTFSATNLAKYRAIVFDNTNNEIFDQDEQKQALQQFLRAGGGMVGIHSACGSMRQWPWFWEAMGGKFKRHPKLQTFRIHVKDRDHPSTAPWPETFEWTDEFYFMDPMAKDLHVLLAGDLSSLDDPEKDKYPGKEFGNEYPLAWCHPFEGGRVWYTALGHKSEHYADPRFGRHLLGGILWAMGEKQLP
jgi:uncharacterized protein